MTSRIQTVFSRLKAQNQAGFIPFITAGDPDYNTSLRLLKALPEAGADLIELGMPFTDPMADGPTIQAASLRALKAGQTLQATLDMVAEFREDNQDTPIILMGYYNPIYRFGAEAFLTRCKEVGVDGLIIVDLPPEEDQELYHPAREADIDFIRLLTPTSDQKRLDKILKSASGFLYYVSMTGITGSKEINTDPVNQAINVIKQNTNLPVVVGFGIKTPKHVEAVARFADAVVVGSALVEAVSVAIEENKAVVPAVIEQMQSLSAASKNARIETKTGA